MSTSATAFSPFNPAVIENPYPFYSRLREESPVHYIPELDMRVILRYSDNEFVLQHPELFSSRILEQQMLGEYNPVPEAGGSFLLASDPPEHTQLRRVISPRFGKRIAGLRDVIGQYVDEAITEMRGVGAFDFNEVLAKPLPIQTFFTLMGVPRSMHEQCKEWTNAIDEGSRYSASNTQPDPETAARLTRSSQEYAQFLKDIIASRLQNPSDDLASDLVGSITEGLLTEVEVRKNIHLLIGAGTESTQKLLANMALAFAQHPDQYRRVAQDRSLVPSAVKEALRYDGPALHMGRQVLEEVELSGTVLPAGSLCLLSFGSANHDPDVFDDPEVFDVTRDPTGVLSQHLGFSGGIHRCLGLHLATLEAEVVLEKLIDAFPDGFDWDPENFIRDEKFFMRGPNKLVLRPR